MSSNLTVSNGPVPRSGFTPDMAFRGSLLVNRCASCGDYGTDLPSDRGTTFCGKCLQHGTLDPVWSDWDDIGGGD